MLRSLVGIPACIGPLQLIFRSARYKYQPFSGLRVGGPPRTRSFPGRAGAPAPSGAIPPGSESARNIESRISECPSLQDNIGRPLRKNIIQTTYLLGGLVCLLPFASFSGEWAPKFIHVHLGGPLRHPNTFLGGPFRWHRADFRHVWPPGPKWPRD